MASQALRIFLLLSTFTPQPSFLHRWNKIHTSATIPSLTALALAKHDCQSLNPGAELYDAYSDTQCMQAQ